MSLVTAGAKGAVGSRLERESDIVLTVILLSLAVVIALLALFNHSPLVKSVAIAYIVLP